MLADNECDWTWQGLIARSSEVLVRLMEAHRLLRVDHEVTRVNVVAFHDHFKDFGLVNGSLFHEVDDLILHSDRMVDIVVKLHLDLILQLSVFLEEVLLVDRVGKVLIILRQQVNLTIVRPAVEAVAHWVLRPNSHVLAAAQEQEPVDFLVEALPVEDVGHPGERVGQVEERQCDLPRPEEGVHEEDVPAEGHEAVVHDVGILEVHRRMLDVVARVEKQLTFTVEFNGLAWLVDAIGALEVFVGTLRELGLRRVNDLVQVVDLAEVARLEGAHHGTLTGGEEEGLGHQGLLCLSCLEGLGSPHCKFIQHIFYYYNTLIVNTININNFYSYQFNSNYRQENTYQY